NSGRSLPILPTGVVSRVPFQKPLRSGCRSAMRGTGLLDLTSGAVSVGSCADNRLANAVMIVAVSSIRIESMCQRVDRVVDAELQCRRGVVHRHAALVDPFEKLAEIVVVVQDHLQISLRIAKPE